MSEAERDAGPSPGPDPPVAGPGDDVPSDPGPRRDPDPPGPVPPPAEGPGDSGPIGPTPHAGPDPAPPPAPQGSAGAAASDVAVQAVVAPAPAVVAPAPAPVAPASLGTRLIGLGYVVLSGLLFYFFASHAFGSDLGTENARLRLAVRAATALLLYPGLLGLVALATGVRPRAAWNVLGLPFEPWWLDTLLAMTWREVRAFFYQPVAYIVMFVFLTLNGFLFVLLLEFYGRPGQMDYQDPASGILTNNIFLWVSLWFICPAITMRLLAEEHRAGTIETLLTAPVTHVQVVLSKYLGAFAFYVVMLLPIWAYLAIMRQYATDWDWGPVAGGYLGLLLVGALYLSIGLFSSTLTKSQVVAYVIAILPIFLLFGISIAESFVENEGLRRVVQYVSLQNHHQDLVKGIVRWKTVVFYGSGVLFFLFLAVRGVESHKWR